MSKFNIQFQEFITRKQDNYYGFDGLHDSNISTPPCHVYKLHKEDFTFDEKENAITLNIGEYYDKKLKYLLNSLFIPLDELQFDLGKYIKLNNIKLILNNNYRFPLVSRRVF